MYKTRLASLRNSYLQMSISGRDEKLIQKLIDNIKRGQFDENDIDSLFIKLRRYSAGYNLFREIADFVAHSDKRNKGITFDSLEAFYLSMKFFLDYKHQEKTLDITNEMPLYVKKLMVYQISKTKEEDLKKFNFTKEKLENKINSYFKENKRNKTCKLNKSTLHVNFVNAINHLLGFIGSHPAFVQEEIIDELISILKDKDLINEEDQEKIISYENEITVCLLSLLHNTKFEFSKNHHAICKISSEKSSIFLGSPSEESFGKLQLNGIIPMEPEHKDLKFAFPVVATNLDATEWISENILKKEVQKEKEMTFEFLKLDFDSDTFINSDYKIEKV